MLYALPAGNVDTFGFRSLTTGPPFTLADCALSVEIGLPYAHTHT